MIDTIQLSNDRAKLSDSMKAISEIVPTIEATMLTCQRFALTSSDSAESDAE
jgi:hypothetical protein